MIRFRPEKLHRLGDFQHTDWWYLFLHPGNRGSRKDSQPSVSIPPPKILSVLGTDNQPSEDKAPPLMAGLPPTQNKSSSAQAAHGYLAEPKANKSSSKRIFLQGLEDEAHLHKPPSAKEHSGARRKSERDQQPLVTTGKFGELVSPKALKSILTPKNRQKIGVRRPSVFASVSELASPKNFRISSRVSIITDKTKRGVILNPPVLLEQTNLAEAEAAAVMTHRARRVLLPDESTYDEPIGGLSSFVRVLVPIVGDTGIGVLDSQIDPILTDFFNKLVSELNTYHPAAKFDYIAKLSLLMEDYQENSAWIPLEDVFLRAEDHKRKKRPKRKRPPTSSEDPPTDSAQPAAKEPDSPKVEPEEVQEPTKTSSRSRHSKGLRPKPQR